LRRPPSHGPHPCRRNQAVLEKRSSRRHQRIIAEADVALMMVYRQFGGKDALVAAALSRPPPI